MNETITIVVKVGGAMVRYLPDAQKGNSRELSVAAQSSVQDVLNLWQIPNEQPLMVIVNDAMIARPEYTNVALNDGDVLSLMPPITAG